MSIQTSKILTDNFCKLFTHKKLGDKKSPVFFYHICLIIHLVGNTLILKLFCINAVEMLVADIFCL